MISKVPGSLAPELPPVGPLLGSAYDRALATVFNSWRVIAIMLVLYFIASGFGEWNAIVVATSMVVWLFFAIANSIRMVFRADYRMNASRAGDVVVAGLSMVAVAALLFAGWFALASLLLMPSNWFLWYLPPLVVTCWLSGFFFCAPALAARDASGFRSLDAAARLTSTGYWRGLVVFLATSFIMWVVPSLIESMSEGLQIVFQVRPDSVVSDAVAYTTATVIFVAWTYVGQAAALSTCMWVKALEDARLR